MGCITGLFGIIIPRFVLLVGWYNDQTYWNSLLGLPSCSSGSAGWSCPGPP